MSGFYKNLCQLYKPCVCKICGSNPEMYRLNPNGSTHDGCVVVRCDKCGLSINIKPRDVTVEHGPNATGWDIIYASLDFAEKAAIERWTILMQDRTIQEDDR